MQKFAAEMAKKTAENKALAQESAQHSPLDQRYREIGISAVAAAVRYQGVAKNPAYAPTPTNWDDYPGEAA
ncbi:MAG: hypothetical protein WAL80_11575 [Xanthobacteraceae bacterium]|jgi:hypothetical protein